MTDPWVRKEVQRNEIEELVDKIRFWFESHRSQALGGGAVLLVVIGLLAYMAVHQSEYKEMRQDQLSIGFHSMMSGQTQQAVAIFDDLAAKAPKDKTAAFALLHKSAVLFHERKSQEAVPVLQTFLERFPEDKNLTPFAALLLGTAQEDSGALKEAQSSYQKFVEKYPEHFLTPNAYDGLARVELLSGQKDEAKRSYEKLLALYPNSSWATHAKTRIQAIP